MNRSRFDQLVEQLVVTGAAALVLESKTPGAWVQLDGEASAVFREPLRSGQILLLLAEIVPRELSGPLLNGAPTRFSRTVNGRTVEVLVEVAGEAVRVEVKPQLLSMPPPGPRATKVPLLELLAQMPARRASHLHVSPGQSVMARVDGALVPLTDLDAWSSEELRAGLASLAPAEAQAAMQAQLRVDFTHVTADAVFHLHLQEARGGVSLVARWLPREVPAPSSLGLPGELVNAMNGSGLWVMAGLAGHGTTTTMASVVQGVVTTRPASVLLVEAPIEYVLDARLGVVRQLEVGTHVASVAEALRDARQGDFDLVALSSIDEPAALWEAISLADQGRLVVAALHAPSAVAAVEKMLSALPSGAERARLAAVFRGAFAQRLCRNTTGGRTLAWELLPGRDQVRATIRDGAVGQLGAMRARALDEMLLELVRRREIEPDVAIAHALDRRAVETALTRVMVQAA